MDIDMDIEDVEDNDMVIGDEDEVVQLGWDPLARGLVCL